jgi:hypothetical protein
MSRRTHREIVGAICLVAALAAGGCTTQVSPDRVSTSASASVASPSSSVVAAPQMIPQPDVGRLDVAPDADRVDLVVPVFPNPTTVDNPLFPVSQQESVLMLGHVDDLPFRTEVTLLPWTRVITWDGQAVETLVSQYVAFLDGRIEEVAFDYYAQADDGSVWYFGEDVYNFADGGIIDTLGTWLAGIDGPPAMIMPGSPQEGDVYRTENIPGLAFEEVTVKAVDQPLDGPLGTVDGGLIVEELHMEGDTEDKSFGPGYGEFYTAGGGDVEALAMAVPTDAASGATPDQLASLAAGRSDLFRAAGRRNWRAATSAMADVTRAWQSLRGGGDVPRLVKPVVDKAMKRLAAAVRSRESAAVRQTSIGIGQSILDLELRYQPASEVDLARFRLWTTQLLEDMAAKDAAAISGDQFTLDYIRDRVFHSLDAARRTRLDVALEELNTAIGDDKLTAAASIARELMRATH